ncbi:MAG TPA: RecQ family ATP-dependent DNA helicase [Clostridia bacterium]|nr:RecQ family ATP-dependent DNA helicase [Clostridia bacterium]
MRIVTFADIEVDINSGRILDIGSIKSNGDTFHCGSVDEFAKFLCGSQYICGHNILNHDLKYIEDVITQKEFDDLRYIDTLYLSPLLFPARPYHALLKNDKLQSDDVNNPLNDSIKARDLFFDEVTAYNHTDKGFRDILYHLLKDEKEFSGFFHFIKCRANGSDIENRDDIGDKTNPGNKIDIKGAIKKKFHPHICENADLKGMISAHPIELAYCLALINANNRYSITPPWVLKSFPRVENVMYMLRGRPCLEGCTYCHKALDIHNALKTYFGYDSYREYGGEPLQEKAVKAAVDNKSLLAVFPTGGGKSIAFQIPALISGDSTKGLTVVISPLQSLMKDQVDNLEEVGITEAVTINGLLDPIERAKSFERVEKGSASILYISPESLRSRTIERLLLGRNIVRFVIDEAHCFSAWGQDFRVDYMYIGDFIKSIQEKKNIDGGIPVSCFTATAKQNVIDDIQKYFKDKLSLELNLYTAGTSRDNLRYMVFNKEGEEEKYNAVRDLIEGKKCPTIIYVSRTRRASMLAQRLSQDGYPAKPYHGKMDKGEKTQNQDAFIKGEVDIMVATSAFGMGVDKKDVGMVIHYEISDSLESYIQEAGRAGRDENMSADCYVLFNDEDLSKHFILLNQTKLSIKEIQQVWKAIKDVTGFRSKVSQSALEIARKAGWDDSVVDIETRVTAAIAALEDAGYLKRGQNAPRIFANSILTKNAREAIERIQTSERFMEDQKVSAVRIIRRLFSSKSSKHQGDEAESRVDYISDHLGLPKGEVIQIINLLREEGILADAKDLTAFIRGRQGENHSRKILRSYWQIERFLLSCVEDGEQTLHIKDLNQRAEESGCEGVTPGKIKTVLNFWAIKNWIKKQTHGYSRNHIAIMPLHERNDLEDRLAKRYELSDFILGYLYEKSKTEPMGDPNGQEDVLVEFSVLGIKEGFENRQTLIKAQVSSKDIEDALYYLSKIDALKIEGGFMVIYKGLTIERIERDNRKRYKVQDYEKLKQFYDSKVQQIHIVGEYARKMIHDYKSALEFVDDYFQLNYSSFLRKYFKGNRQKEITKNITPAKFRQLFGDLSPTQLKIINDSESKYIVVAAGPGSGKTRILVHKLASLLLMEDVKHEQLLMVTFSRAAATEFKKRLLGLIGNAANFVEIKTFHSYCFDLLGRVGSLEMSGQVIKEATDRIRNGDVEPGRITKTVLVIDEAQDMDADEFSLIKALMEYNDNMRVIAVGDDDQNIFEFRGSSSKYLWELANKKGAAVYELVENYRSRANIVDFSNQFVQKISHRMKTTQIIPVKDYNGDIKIVRHRSRNLVTPLVNDLISGEITGTVCVLTKTNEEAAQVTGLLLMNGIKARLIQSNDDFSLYNVLEVRYFLDHINSFGNIYTISDDLWEDAKAHLAERYSQSTNYGLCMNIIRDFELTNTGNKYISDLEVFIRESRMEDFLDESMETILVSTIHKAKGREFDNVFLVLDRFACERDESRRQLYVAMTRAKCNLTVHYNGEYLDFIRAADLNVVDDLRIYTSPPQLAVQLGFKDVWLDFFQWRQHLISDLSSGDTLIVDRDCCCNDNGQAVIRFSKGFVKRLETMKKYGYVPRTGRARFIVYWKKENTEREIEVILPEIHFERIEGVQEANL